MSGATALRSRFHSLVSPPSDHACTAWFHRSQTTLVTSGPIVQKPLEQLPQVTPNVYRTALQLTGWCTSQFLNFTRSSNNFLYFVLVTNVGEENKPKASDLRFSRPYSYESLLRRDATYLAGYTASHSRRQHLHERPG
jgi:hypothetical protein